MEIYSTEEQQVEAIKKWWTDNGKAVLLGAIVGLGGLYGWRYYQSKMLTDKEQASQSYTQALNALNSDKKDALSEAENFIKVNNDDAYAQLLSLQLVKTLVEANELDKAAAQLRLVQKSKDEILSALGTMRLARVEMQLGNVDNALAELKKVSSKSWVPQIEELRGDIEAQKGNVEEAINAYTASIAATPNPVVQMKLDNLSI